MLLPTLVNKASPSTRVLRSRKHSEIEKVEENEKASVSGSPRPLPPQSAEIDLAGTAETGKYKMAACFYRPENASEWSHILPKLELYRN